MMDQACIQAEVEAEIRRIEAWNQSASSCEFETCEVHSEPLSEEQIVSLASHLVHNRLQVEMGAAEEAKRG